MPVAVHIRPGQMSRSDYDQVIAQLESEGAPDGRLFHAGYGGDDVQMFEVWESKEQFEAHRDRLGSILQGAGLDAGSVEIHELHSATPD